MPRSVPGAAAGRSAAAALLLLCSTGGAGLAAPSSGDPASTLPLRASCYRASDAAGGVRLAVRWLGGGSLEVVVWGDADGDGVRGAREPALASRTLEPGYAVLELEGAPGGPLRIGAAPDGAGGLSLLAADDCSWRDGFAGRDLDGLVRTGAGYDDGTGEQLYLGGDFTSAGDVVVNHVARWDGATWSAVPGSTAIGTNGLVAAMEVFDGYLYIGGSFTRAGDLEVANLARWSAAGWEEVGDVDGTVFALNRHQDASGMKLYVGGAFTHAGGLEAGRIARFDGTSWSNVGPAAGFNGTVRALENYDDGAVTRLFAGGDFTSVAGPGAAGHVARWDGTGWSTLGTGPDNGVDGTVHDLAVFTEAAGEALFVGGFFQGAQGGVDSPGIARWRTLAWSSVGGGVTLSGGAVGGLVYTMNVYDDGNGERLVVGGHFSAAGGVTASNLARWSGTAWSAQFGTSDAGADREVFAVGALGEGPGAELLVGGGFLRIGGVRASRIAVWSGSSVETFRPLSAAPAGVGLDDAALAMAVYDEGAGPRLFVGGQFESAGDVPAKYLARWDGAVWSEVHSMVAGGVNGPVYALEVWDPGGGARLYAGGMFSYPGHNLAAWNGSGWSAVGPVGGGEGTNGIVYALRGYAEAAAPGLYVGGNFDHAGGLAAEGIARWDGTAWHDVTTPFSPVAYVDGDVYALEVYDDGGGPALFAGGQFTVVNRGATNLARWRGNEWSKLGGAGPDSAVNALALWDDGTGEALYAGGWFTHADAVEAAHVVRWDGSAWAALAGPAGNGTDGNVWTLAPYVDGDGHALFAGGSFTHAGGVAAEHVARWDAGGWRPLDDPSGHGLDDSAYDLLSYDDGRGPSLWAAGLFGVAGGEASTRIARWMCDTIFWDDYESGGMARWDDASDAP